MKIRRFMSRYVEVIDDHDKMVRYSLAVAYVSVDSSGIIRHVKVVPFEKETAGVEYIDHPLRLRVGYHLPM